MTMRRKPANHTRTCNNSTRPRLHGRSRLLLASAMPWPRADVHWSDSAESHTIAAGTSKLARFSAGMYCAAVEDYCPLPGGRRGRPGECFWLRHDGASWRPVTGADMRNRSADPDLDRWDPSAFGQKGFRRLGKGEAARCLRGRRCASPWTQLLQNAKHGPSLACGATGSLWSAIAPPERCTPP